MLVGVFVVGCWLLLVVCVGCRLLLDMRCLIVVVCFIVPPPFFSNQKMFLRVGCLSLLVCCALFVARCSLFAVCCLLLVGSLCAVC